MSMLLPSDSTIEDFINKYQEERPLENLNGFIYILKSIRDLYDEPDLPAGNFYAYLNELQSLIAEFYEYLESIEWV